MWAGVAVRVSRRWLLVAAGSAGLVGAAALPRAAGAAAADPAALRELVLAGPPPHVGYVESVGRLGLPELPDLASTTALFTGTTRIRTFVAGRERWRVDELTPVGERGTYRLDGRDYTWDFGFDQLTEVVGTTTLRLPRAADLVPAELARRILALAPADPVTALPGRRVAGRSAAGLRLAPADPDTTVGRVDVWADPATGLALRVEVAARSGPVLLESELLDVTDGPPDPDVLVPPVPPGAGFVRTAAADVGGALRVLDAPPAPARLAGRDRATAAAPSEQDLPGVGRYGGGLAGFALVPVGRGVAERAVDGAAAAGGTELPTPVGRAVGLATPLLSVVVRAGRGAGTLLVGTVRLDVLAAALADVPLRRRR